MRPTVIGRGRQLTSLGLEAKLILLAEEVLSGNTSAMVEFQQLSQEAPPELRLRLRERLHKL